MRRVVITGLGIVSCLGNNQDEVHQSLLNSKSGISYSEEYKEHNLKSHVHGKPNIKLEDHIDRKTIRFMGSGSAYNYIAMKEAIKDSGLEEIEVSNIKTGIVMGSGGPSIENVILAADKTRAKTPKLMGPFVVGDELCISDTGPAPTVTRGQAASLPRLDSLRCRAVATRSAAASQGPSAGRCPAVDRHQQRTCVRSGSSRGSERFQRRPFLRLGDSGRCPLFKT